MSCFFLPFNTGQEFDNAVELTVECSAAENEVTASWNSANDVALVNIEYQCHPVGQMPDVRPKYLRKSVPPQHKSKKKLIAPKERLRNKMAAQFIELRKMLIYFPAKITSSLQASCIYRRVGKLIRRVGDWWLNRQIKFRQWRKSITSSNCWKQIAKFRICQTLY